MNLSDYFTTDHRTDGTPFVRLTDDAPEWLTDAVREAHDGELPDDWRFETCRAIAQEMEGRDELVADVDVADDLSHEIADSLTDIYTHDLLTWLSGNINRADYCDRATEDVGHGETIVDSIRQGQYLCIAEMADVLIATVREVRSDD